MKKELKKHIASLGILIVFGILATGSIDTDTPSSSSSTPAIPESSLDNKSKNNNSIENTKSKNENYKKSNNKEQIHTQELEIATEALKVKEAKGIENLLTGEEKWKRREARAKELNEIIQNASESEDIIKRDAYKEFYEIYPDLSFYKEKYEQYSKKVDEKIAYDKKNWQTERSKEILSNIKKYFGKDNLKLRDAYNELVELNPNDKEYKRLLNHFDEIVIKEIKESVILKEQAAKEELRQKEQLEKVYRDMGVAELGKEYRKGVNKEIIGRIFLSYGASVNDLNLISTGSISIGMSKVALVGAIGKPESIRTYAGGNYNRDQYIYPGWNFIYIQDGKVTDYQIKSK